MYNYAASVEYDGTDFKGFQLQQGNIRTVQGELQKAILKITGSLKDFTYAGRTDAGVHAKHQVISFITDNVLDLYKFKWNLNCILPEDITVKGIKNVDLKFNARKDAILREYSYFVVNNNCQSVFLKKYSIMIYGKIDVNMMKTAAEKFVGVRDFAAFYNHDYTDRNINETDKNCSLYTTRSVYSLKIKKFGSDLIIFKIAANAFLYNMVRIIVGTLIEIGRGQREPGSIDRAFKTGNREDAGKIVPPKGLILTNVVY